MMMSIKILPARLANQIAAGEVVERPASVVKELIENSLDAGATRIEVDIEQGGAKCIRIKDNGKGVSKEELTLALSRHATSKISHLDDLESIVSLGFRGEALASVSSVSRLTFTSKPADQAQAWQAVAEGRDMEVKVQPAAHPQGTTVEVLDLFFNTPARRRFLKTEKTEFQHIDELIKRIALSRFDIAITLKHNHKVVRQYRAASEQAQQEKRIATICSEQFMQHALFFEHQDQGLKISGWVSDRLSPRQLADVQYCYINGRMIRDKLVNHAIKQVYAHFLPQGMFPGYIIYIECDAKEVDVNVHPAKHEVRFHQARWVHDFISSTLNVTLNESSLLNHQDTVNEHEHVAEHSYQPSTASFHQQASHESSHHAEGHHRSGHYSGEPHRPLNTGLSHQQVDAYCDFVAEAYQQAIPVNSVPLSAHSVNDIEGSNILALIDADYALIQSKGHVFSTLTNNGLLLFSLKKASELIVSQTLFSAWQNGEIISQPLLLPVRFKADKEIVKIAKEKEKTLQRLGFSYKFQTQSIIVSQVPSPFRHAPIATILPKLFDYLVAQPNDDVAHTEVSIKRLCDQLGFLLTHHDSDKWFSGEEIQTLLISLGELSEEVWQACLKQPNLSLLTQDFH